MGRSATHAGPTTTVTKIDESTPKNKFGRQRKNLGSIIRGYKSAVTTQARKNGIEFNWQNLFHEHIIRSQSDFHRISHYILKNPEKLNPGDKTV